MSNRPRILLSAYQCAPGVESVSKIGWHWYFHLSQRLPVTLVTHIRNQSALVKAGAPLHDSEIIYVDTEWFAQPLYKLAWMLFPRSEHARFLLTSLDFYVYDWKTVQILKKRQRAGIVWDLIHVPTPVSPRAATRLHSLGHPLILGPWNGNISLPDRFGLFANDCAWIYPARYFANFMHWLWGTFRYARLILVANQTTCNSVPKQYHTRCHIMLENAVDLAQFRAQPYPELPSATQPLRLVFVGRLVYFKGLHMLLEAMATIRRRHQVVLTVVGDGPLRETWQALSRDLKIDDLVTFHGNLPAEEVNKQINAAHVLCLPSVRESGGAVLLEAMACARPVIAVAFGGPADLVDDEVGKSISPSNEAHVIQGFIDAFDDLLAHPDAWRKRGEAGHQRAEQFYDWNAKINTVMNLYQQILEPHA